MSELLRLGRQVALPRCQRAPGRAPLGRVHDQQGALHERDLVAVIIDRVGERGRFVPFEGPSLRIRHLERLDYENSARACTYTCPVAASTKCRTEPQRALPVAIAATERTAAICPCRTWTLIKTVEKQELHPVSSTSYRPEFSRKYLPE